MGALDPDVKIEATAQVNEPRAHIAFGPRVRSLAHKPEAKPRPTTMACFGPTDRVPIPGSIVGDLDSGLLWLDPLFGTLGGCSYAESQPMGSRVVVREARSQWHQLADVTGFLPLKAGCAIVFEPVGTVPAVAFGPGELQDLAPADFGPAPPAPPRPAPPLAPRGTVTSGPRREPSDPGVGFPIP